MKLNKTARSVIFAVLSAGLLSACGAGEKPTVEEVKAWRLKTLDKRYHTTLNYDITNLVCTDAPDKAIANVKAAYAAMGGTSSSVIKAYASCSYTIDGTFKSRAKKGDLIVAPDYEVKHYNVKDEIFVLGVTEKKREWQGNLHARKAK
jgi:hypothetical protein